MIVRIMGDGQYRIDGRRRAVIEEIERLDGELVRAELANDEGRFRVTLAHLIGHVRRNGKAVPLAELAPSDLMVPAADMSLAETRRMLEQVPLPSQTILWVQHR